MTGDRHRISLDDAAVMTRRARDASLLPVRAWRFDAGIVREMLEQPAATGLRIYLGVTEAGEPTVLLVATDDADHDLRDGPIAEYAWPCPPFCDASSPLGGA